MPVKVVARAQDLEPLVADDDQERWDDVTLDRVELYGQRDLHRVRLENAVLDGQIERTIEGASTVSLTVHDPARELLQANTFANQRFDLRIDNSWFRLVGVRKQGDDLEFTFEDRIVAWLRGYDKPRKAYRDKVTRAQFIVSMANEVKEGSFRFYCPELKKVQPIAATKRKAGKRQARAQQKQADAARLPGVKEADTGKTAAASGGTPNVTVKGQSASGEQVRNIQTILSVGVKRKAPTPVLISAIMAATQESEIKNLSGADGTSVGLFQLIDSWGSVERRMDPVWVSNWYYDRAIPTHRQNPSMSLNDLCQAVERSGFPNAYGQWQAEATRTVKAFAGQDLDLSGLASASGSSTTTKRPKRYAFERGQSGKRETSWDAMGRLVEEVGWRRFVVGRTLVVISEEDLFASRPRMTLREDSPGVEAIDFDIVMGRPLPKGKRRDPKRNAAVQEMTVTARAGRWQAPPGTIVAVDDMGPADGRWLVTSTSRGLFERQTEITLAKPMRELPEPAAEVEEISQAGGDSGVAGEANLEGGRASGEYAGTKALFDQVIHPFMRSKGLTPGSQKRPTKYTSSGGISDHWVGNMTAYATDYPTTSGAGTAQALARHLGIAANVVGTYTRHTIGFGGARMSMQILWAVSGHYDHIHVGAQRV